MNRPSRRSSFRRGTAIPTGDGFYTALGETADSLLRERIFEELCNRYGYTYDDIYDSWLNESPLPSPIVWESEQVPLAHVIGLLDVEELQHVLKSGISRDIQPIRSGVGESARHEFIDRGEVGEFMVETAGEARVGEGVLDVHDA